MSAHNSNWSQTNRVFPILNDECIIICSQGSPCCGSSSTTPATSTRPYNLRAPTAASYIPMTTPSITGPVGSLLPHHGHSLHLISPWSGCGNDMISSGAPRNPQPYGSRRCGGRGSMPKRNCVSLNPSGGDGGDSRTPWRHSGSCGGSARGGRVRLLLLLLLLLLPCKRRRRVGGTCWWGHRRLGQRKAVSLCAASVDARYPDDKGLGQ